MNTIDTGNVRDFHDNNDMERHSHPTVTRDGRTCQGRKSERSQAVKAKGSNRRQPEWKPVSGWAGPSVQTGKLLVIPADGSHWNNIKSLVEELGRRGNEVVVVIPKESLSLGPSKHTTTLTYPVNYTVAQIKKQIASNLGNYIGVDTSTDLARFQKYVLMIDALKVGSVKNVESLLFNKDLMKTLVEWEFDAVLTDPFECVGVIVGEYLSIPSIYMQGNHPCDAHFLATKSPSPPSYVPHLATHFTDRMTFWQRGVNTLRYFLQPMACGRLYTHADRIASAFLRKETSMLEIMSRAAIWLEYIDYATEFPRPLMPNVIMMGPIAPETKPLPQQTFATGTTRVQTTVALWFLTLLCGTVGVGHSSKVQVVPVDGSHWLGLKLLVEELSHRGHEVMVLVPETSLLICGADTYTTRNFKVPYTMAEPDTTMDKLKEGAITPPQMSDLLETMGLLLNFTDMYVKGREGLLYDGALMRSLREQSFDLLLTDPFLPCGPIITDAFALPAVHFLGGLPLRAGSCSAVQDLETFVNGSGEHGFVIFTLGSMVSELPEVKAGQFLEAFRHIPQKVVWRYTGALPKDVPKNVKLMNWLPQNDLLAHPKAKAFITHGGTHSIYEGICNGVPMVTIPLFGDQADNVQRVVSRGVAETVNIFDLTSEKLLVALRKVINDKSYKEKMMKLSVIHRDRPIKPLDLAVYWTEYVMRHKGAAHLRSAANELNWIQYHSLDVIGFLLLVLVTVVCVTVKTCMFCFKKCFRVTPKKKKLGFSAGDRVVVHAKVTSDWWWAEVGGCFGYVPSGYLHPAPTEGNDAWQDEEYFGSYGSLRFHLEMLSDRPRTETYKQVIVSNSAVLREKVILDLGCGTGIISLFCGSLVQTGKRRRKSQTKRECSVPHKSFTNRPVALKEFFSKPKFSHRLAPEDCLSAHCDVITLDMHMVQVSDLEKLRGEFYFPVESPGTPHAFSAWFVAKFNNEGGLALKLSTGPCAKHLISITVNPKIFGLLTAYT
ncbi:hypothetical protein P4O66_002487 [Electrophorus voltai]|uniref:glucuronosyltransferase n=1 Tax=Electrophorus voltai TaxID=2609070 RepID=A0AAD8YZ69_9TELE|nr:hypothetical protein P4O66_002487 [Electrophorus voltai]